MRSAPVLPTGRSGRASALVLVVALGCTVVACDESPSQSTSTTSSLVDDAVASTTVAATTVATDESSEVTTVVGVPDSAGQPTTATTGHPPTTAEEDQPAVVIEPNAPIESGYVDWRSVDDGAAYVVSRDQLVGIVDDGRATADDIEPALLDLGWSWDNVIAILVTAPGPDEMVGLPSVVERAPSAVVYAPDPSALPDGIEATQVRVGDLVFGLQVVDTTTGVGIAFLEPVEGIVFPH